MHSRVLLYGYESYTGRFIKWYAEYYHSINIDYLVSTDMSRGRAYDMEIFRPSVIDFDYKDVKNAIIWLVEPLTEELKKDLEAKGYVENETYFDFYKQIYGNDIFYTNKPNVDIYHKKKEGKRDIQFLEYLEWKYDCNFVTRIPYDQLENKCENGGGGTVVQPKKKFFLF